MIFNDFLENCNKRVKAKNLNSEQFFFYRSIITTLMLSKFKINNCPDDITSDQILKSLLFGGTSAMVSADKMSSDKNFVGIPILSGVTQYTDLYEYARLVNPRGESKDLKVDEEIAVGYNNFVHTPEFDILRFALFLTEVDSSMHINILNSRVTPIFKASNAQQAKKFDSIRNSIYNGELSCIELNDFQDNLTSENSHVLYLTDPKNIDKVQYLTKVHDDLIRRLCNLHGITMNTTGKMAQLTTSELNEYSEFSSIYVNQQYDLLCEYIESANKINGFDMSVEWGYAFQRFVKGEAKLDETIDEITNNSSKSKTDDIENNNNMEGDCNVKDNA